MGSALPPTSAADVLSDQTGYRASVGRNHEMCGPFDRRKSRSVHARTEERVRALNGGVAGATPNDEDAEVDGSEQCRRQREAIGTGPVKDVDRRGLDRVAANPLRPRSERAGATVEVDHVADRFD